MIFNPGQQNEATKFILKHFEYGKYVVTRYYISCN
jgi:hypothetical protein